MADNFKHPAIYVAGLNTVILAGSMYYVYQQIGELKATCAALERQLSNLKMTLAKIQEQDGDKARLMREANERINTVGVKASTEIEALNSYISAMNTDLHGLAEQLTNSGVQVELISASNAAYNYQGEMRFPTQYGHTPVNNQYGQSPLHSYNYPDNHNGAVPSSPASGPNPALINSNVAPNYNRLQTMPASGMPQPLMTGTNNKLPMLGRGPPPTHMQMHMNGMHNNRMSNYPHNHPTNSNMTTQPARQREPDPIGDLVELAQSQPDSNGS